MIQLGQARAFLAVARAGNVKRAAGSLHLSQPAVTARIHALELELGAALFRRTSRGMEVTAAGRALMPHIERALESMQRGADVVRDIQRGTVGELTIGAEFAIAEYVLPRLIRSFTTEFPQVRVSIRTGHTENVIDRVARGDVSIGITRELRDHRVSTRRLYDDELTLVAAPDHPLCRAEPISVQALQNERIVLFDHITSYYGLSPILLQRVGSQPHAIMELDNIEVARRMVEHGVGIGFLPATAAADAITSGALRRLRLTDFVPIHRRIVAVTRPSVELWGSVRAFDRMLDRISEFVPTVAPTAD